MKEKQLNLFTTDEVIGASTIKEPVAGARKQFKHYNTKRLSKDTVRKQVTVYISPALYKAVRMYCLENDTTFSAFVNMLIDKHLKSR